LRVGKLRFSRFSGCECPFHCKMEWARDRSSDAGQNRLAQGCRCNRDHHYRYQDYEHIGHDAPRKLLRHDLSPHNRIEVRAPLQSSSYVNGYVNGCSPRAVDHRFNKLALSNSVAAIQT
jgi:hypothetical protein